jgi:hypothetical protein
MRFHHASTGNGWSRLGSNRFLTPSGKSRDGGGGIKQRGDGPSTPDKWMNRPNRPEQAVLRDGHQAGGG